MPTIESIIPFREQFTCVAGPPKTGKSLLVTKTLQKNTFVRYDHTTENIDYKIRTLVSIGACIEPLWLILDEVLPSKSLFEHLLNNLARYNIRLVVITKDLAWLRNMPRRDLLQQVVLTGWTTLQDEDMRNEVWKLERFFSKFPFGALIFNTNGVLLGWYKFHCQGTISIKAHNRIRGKIVTRLHRLSNTKLARFAGHQ